MTLTKNRLKELRALGLKKRRGELRSFLVEGFRLVQEAAASDHEILAVLHTAECAANPGGKTLLQKLRKKCPRVELVSEREIRAVSETVTTQGILAVVREKLYDLDALLQKGNVQSLLVAIDAVSDPGNLGSMIRTCDWFGVSGILVGENSAELYSPKVVRSTMGGLFHLPVVQDVDLLAAMSKAKSVGYAVYVTDAAGESHFDRVRYASKSFIIFGNEAWGVSDKVKSLADCRIAIRRYGAAESLNVGVACGIVLSAIHRLYDE